MDESNHWEYFNATNIDNLDTRGYSGAVFDGQYIYYIPNYNGKNHANVLRFNTHLEFTNILAWSAFNATYVGGHTNGGFIGGVFDGRHLYFTPFYGPSSGRILRYDTHSDFTNPANWSVFDPGHLNPYSANKRYIGAVYAPGFVYFVEHTVDGYSVLRYDIASDFADTNSWTLFIGKESSQGFLQYEGGVFDGRYIYLTPNIGQRWFSSYYQSGIFLQYDTQTAFTNPNNWSAFSFSWQDKTNQYGYQGAVFDGQYVYFIPDKKAVSYTSEHHGLALRYDTSGSFTDQLSWTAFDPGNINGLYTKGFAGGAYDGRFVYYVPNGESFDIHGNVIRYDTHLPFCETNSWSAINMPDIFGINAIGYFGAAFDGAYVYFVPMTTGIPHSRMVRFNAKAPDLIPGTISGGSFF